MSHAACNFSPSTKGVSASVGSTKDSFPQGGFMFPKATLFLEYKVFCQLGTWLSQDFSSLRFYFSTSTLILQSWGQVTSAKYLHVPLCRDDMSQGCFQDPWPNNVDVLVCQGTKISSTLKITVIEHCSYTHTLQNLTNFQYILLFKPINLSF